MPPPEEASAPSPRTALAATVASLAMEAPVGAQASCRHVTAAYRDDG